MLRKGTGVAKNIKSANRYEELAEKLAAKFANELADNQPIPPTSNTQ